MSRVETTTLRKIVDFVERGDEAALVAEFPGLVLLAMGVLTAEERKLRTALLNATSPMQFGERAKHDPHQQHPLSGVAFHLRLSVGEQVVLGRSQLCDIVVPDESVSEQHCRLEAIEVGLAVCDLKSTNGTRINQQPLHGDDPGYLAFGDLLTTGRCSFQLYGAATLYAELEAIALLSAC
jgi:hypothetical protein